MPMCSPWLADGRPGKSQAAKSKPIRWTVLALNPAFPVSAKHPDTKKFGCALQRAHPIIE
jgi:hypothetical protein